MVARYATPTRMDFFGYRLLGNTLFHLRSLLPHLKIRNIDMCKFGAEFLRALANEAPQLETLGVRRLHNMRSTRRMLVSLFPKLEFRALKKLTILSRISANGEHKVKPLSHFVLPQIQDFCIEDRWPQGENFFGVIANRAPDVRTLTHSFLGLHQPNISHVGRLKNLKALTLRRLHIAIGLMFCNNSMQTTYHWNICL